MESLDPGKEIHTTTASTTTQQSKQAADGVEVTVCGGIGAFSPKALASCNCKPPSPTHTVPAKRAPSKGYKSIGGIVRHIGPSTPICGVLLQLEVDSLANAHRRLITLRSSSAFHLCFFLSCRPGKVNVIDFVRTRMSHRKESPLSKSRTLLSFSRRGRCQ